MKGVPMVLRIRGRYIALFLAVQLFIFAAGVLWGFTQNPCSEKEMRTPASECYVNDLTDRLQDQINEYQRATFDNARMQRDIRELQARVGELVRDVNELDVTLKALGRDR
jgi:hypothetical protein